MESGKVRLYLRGLQEGNQSLGWIPEILQCKLCHMESQGQEHLSMRDTRQ